MALKVAAVPEISSTQTYHLYVRLVFQRTRLLINYSKHMNSEPTLGCGRTRTGIPATESSFAGLIQDLLMICAGKSSINGNSEAMACYSTTCFVLLGCGRNMDRTSKPGHRRAKSSFT